MTNRSRAVAFLHRGVLLPALFVFLATFFPLSAFAEAADASEAAEAASDPAEEKETFLDEVTVTATRGERALRDTPGQVDVVDRREIEERGYTGLDDLVRYLPGVQVEGDPTRLGTSGFTIRGIGGNRVLTEIDGVPTAEQFDFGPFSVHRFALDVDALESVEIVRSAGSALYGSDALGGVVALRTRGPRGYLAGERRHFETRAGFDGRDDEASVSGVAAVGSERWQGSLYYSRRDGHELDNQGEIDTRDASRTRPNPIDRSQDDFLAQVSFTPAASNEWRGAFEYFESEGETEILSAIQGATPFSDAVLASNGFDTQERMQFRLEQGLTRDRALADTVLWRVFARESSTEQRTLETREPAVGTAFRDGLLTFDQETFGARVELRELLGESTVLTWGAAYDFDHFDQLRDRTEVVIATGEPVPTTLALPTKYFPESEVEEIGAFAQAEIELWNGRLSLVPGVRFDRYDLDADQEDRIFLDGNPGTPPPVDLTEESVSPKLGVVLALDDSLAAFAQFARGFRAPPTSAVNNGFTNQAGGYRTQPNPDLRPETSDNLELGLRGVWRRGSFSVTGFENQYDDFIETVTLGFDPSTFLIEFQPQNVANVEIRGVELAGEARFDRRLTLRAAFTYTEGTDETTGEPLSSIAPAQLVVGLRWVAPSGRWGTELVATANDSVDDGDLPADSTQFRVPSSEVVDLLGWVALTERVELQVSVWNLGDETYWSWPYARGLSDDSPTLARYTNPGRSLSAQLRYTF